jgi:tetratricopeptide (TPR) repeat protein
MTKPQTIKLVAIGLYKPSISGLILHCEELYLFGVLSQLARFTEIQCKDFATQTNKIEPDWVSPDLINTLSEPSSKLRQICQSTRTQFLFTGTLLQSENIKSEVEIRFQLYEAETNQFLINKTTTLSLDTENLGEGGNPQIPVTELNQAINKTVSCFMRALYPNASESHDSPETLPPFSQSLSAMKLALKASRNKDSAEKISLYESAIREDPQMESSYCHLARIFKNEYKLEKSIVFYREALKISKAAPRNKATYATEAGISCALLGRNDLALQWWERAIQYDPTYINPYFNIANTMEDQEDYAKAEQYFIKAQALAPDDFRTFLSLARIYSKMGVWDKALNQYQYQLAKEDDDPWCHSDMATCYLNLGDLSNARRHLEKTVALDPTGEAGEYAQLILSGLG